MLTLQPSDWVVSTNQSRACLSELESESRDIPISLGPLNMSDEGQRKHPKTNERWIFVTCIKDLEIDRN